MQVKIQNIAMNVIKNGIIINNKVMINRIRSIFSFFSIESFFYIKSLDSEQPQYSKEWLHFRNVIGITSQVNFLYSLSIERCKVFSLNTSSCTNFKGSLVEIRGFTRNILKPWKCLPEIFRRLWIIQSVSADRSTWKSLQAAY